MSKVVNAFEQQVPAEDGLLLNFYHWIPDNAKAAIVISHGWSEHVGRYRELVNWFTGHGYEVHALDHRGHGKSDGKRGHVRRWLDYARDLELLRSNVQQDKQYLIGHSMGGMISVLHSLEYPDQFSALALSGPATDLSIELPKIKLFLGKTMSSWLPRLSMSNDIDPYVVCSDTQVVEDYIADPFTHGKVTARWFNEYIHTIKRVKEDAKLIKTPLAIWHGEGDVLVEPWVSENFYEVLTMKDRQRKIVDNALHEILLEPTWSETAEEMKSWLEQF
jgi:alpha-beta hydrolase superfamily lysophospholipase